MSNQPVLYWHRQDLRLADNPALQWAVAQGAVIPVFILTDDASDPWPLGGASRWWLHHSLESLQKDYKKFGINLVLRRGEPLPVLRELAQTTGMQAVCWNRCYEPHAIARDTAIKHALSQSGLKVESHNAALLHEPWTIKTASGTPYRVFTPFYRACMASGAQYIPSAAPKKIAAHDQPLASDQLNDWHLLPSKPDWATGLRASWRPGEAGAQQKLSVFIDQAASDYKTLRDRPDLMQTSRLSPHLHWGEISPRQIWQAITTAQAAGKIAAVGTEAYLRQLIWREFSAHLLFQAPQLPDQPLQQPFAKFPWRQDATALRAWQQGRTGYPIVDAGMRELWQTGWMHNRVRMIVASFLVKHLLIPWQEGERWFWDTLVDADLANNAASWQWVAGCGADAAPYFRIFNPILQGQKFDPQGDYVRHYVPELQKLPAEYIHTPWELPAEELKTYGIAIGKTYPAPIVEHNMARQRALEALKAIKV